MDVLAASNTRRAEIVRDPEIAARITQYEMAFRMQTSVPDLVDMNDETEATFDAYGAQSRQPGTFAHHCLLARRMAERGVRFIQLDHRGWDQHYNLPRDLRLQARDVDQPAAALIQDLKQRGLLDETLVVWGEEFGRTTYSQGKLERNNSPIDSKDVTSVWRTFMVRWLTQFWPEYFCVHLCPPVSTCDICGKKRTCTVG